MLATVYIGLGSNVGHRSQQIQAALDKLDAWQGIDYICMSTLIETKAVSTFKQPDFINGVAEFKTILTPKELLEATQTIEKELGRVTKGTHDPRTIDLDILFYDDLIFCDDELTIPHPLLHERSFVLGPMAEIAPDLMHPVFDDSIMMLRLTVVEKSR